MTCQRCGQCCKTLWLRHQTAPGADPEMARAFMEAHGLTIIGWVPGTIDVMVAAVCRHLQEHPDGITSCAIYADRYEACRGYECNKCPRGETNGTGTV